uniref:Uncharacterized protein n=1 Tax=Triticum urartu TaxID=4572 RepID=A0A8R7TIZ7_TRIUA
MAGHPPDLEVSDQIIPLPTTACGMESRDRSPSTNAMRIWRVLTHQDPMTDKVIPLSPAPNPGPGRLPLVKSASTSWDCFFLIAHGFVIHFDKDLFVGVQNCLFPDGYSSTWIHHLWSCLVFSGP